MGRFVYGNALNDELDKLIKGAKEFLFLVSPYIKLHDRLRHELKKLPHKESLSLMLLFGKNEDNVARSLSLEELEFFKEFPNVEIRHEPKLHAKYYANDSTSILTSMNLYDYSMNNNIESGTVYDDRFNIGKQTGRRAYDYFQEVFEGATLLYHQAIDVKVSFGGLRKQYGSIRIKSDNLYQYYGGGGGTSSYHSNGRTYQAAGYCIRTGLKIPFNLDRPLSNEAYRKWSSFSNPDYPESYCHYSGEPSYGKTSYNRPVLQQYWGLARNHS